MADHSPKVLLRMGTHAEKEYFEKLGKKFDGIIVGANLVESTPGATASLILKLCGDNSGLEYYIDPMTYAFGTYVEPGSGEIRDDLDWIKSDQKVKGKAKTVRAFKRSYRKLAARLGDPFEHAVQNSTALTPDTFEDQRTVKRVCSAVIDYQLTRLREEFEADEEYADFVRDIPLPAAVIAPYFYIEPSMAEEWMGVNAALAAEAVRISPSEPVFAVACAPRESLVDDTFQDWLLRDFSRSGINGLWLWFSTFDEYTASTRELRALRRLAQELRKKNLQVLNLHGGFFSLALHSVGLSGISHGVGYGEQKDVVPVIGQSTPTVRYYLPALRRRLGVPDIERCFRKLKVRNADDFYNLICDCAICKGVLRGGLPAFTEFGEKHFSTPTSKREAQTPAAAKRCRFHYLLNRAKEKEWVAAADITDVVDALENDARAWDQTVLADDADQLEKWVAVLSEG